MTRKFAATQQLATFCDTINIRVADYLTLLPPKELLEAKLHRSIEIARQRLALEDGKGQ